MKGTANNLLFAGLFSVLIAGGGLAVADVPGFGNNGDSQITSIGASSSRSDDIYVEVNRSYECTVLSNNTSDTLTLLFVDGSGNALDATANKIRSIGNVTPQILSESGAANNRLSIQPVLPYTSTTRLRTTNISGSTISTERVCLETTLYGGYNTNANPYNFLELTNITNASVTAKVRGYNFDGTATVNSTVTIGPNSRFDVDIHSAAGQNKYGILIVTHDGPYGALIGYVSQYTGTPESLIQTGSIKLKPRQTAY